MADNPALEAIADALTARAVSCKVPRFLHYDVDLWAIQAAAAFATAKITTEETKFQHVLASLDPETLRKVTTYISSPTPAAQYTGLVAALRAAYGKSKGDRYDEFFALTLGEARPTELYASMRRLWLDDNAATSQVFRQAFIRKLPADVRVALATSTANAIEEFLALADRLMEQHRLRSSTNPPGPPRSTPATWSSPPSGRPPQSATVSRPVPSIRSLSWRSSPSPTPATATRPTSKGRPLHSRRRTLPSRRWGRV